MPANRPRALGAKGEKRALVGNLIMPARKMTSGGIRDSLVQIRRTGHHTGGTRDHRRPGWDGGGAFKCNRQF